MKYICIEFVDGSKREWYHASRPGGSWTKELKLESGWVVVRDEWDNQSIFPQNQVREITTRD